MLAAAQVSRHLNVVAARIGSRTDALVVCLGIPAMSRFEVGVPVDLLPQGRRAGAKQIEDVIADAVGFGHSKVHRLGFKIRQEGTDLVSQIRVGQKSRLTTLMESLRQIGPSEPFGQNSVPWHIANRALL